jgi:hypothetical protein
VYAVNYLKGMGEDLRGGVGVRWIMYEGVGRATIYFVSRRVEI